MIISHRHRFVYVKTRKTASTSIEIALSAHCGPDDVITKITAQDEAVRQRLGVRGPQHEFVRGSDGRTFELLNHAPATVAREILGPAWGDYLTFTIERNPFDRVISQYFWERPILPPPATLASFLRTTPPERLSNWHLYADDAEQDRVIVDHVGRYESLNDSLATIAKMIGLPGGIVLPEEHTKSHFRTDRRHHRDVLSPEDRQIVETLCRRELAAFDYEW